MTRILSKCVLPGHVCALFLRCFVRDYSLSQWWVSKGLKWAVTVCFVKRRTNHTLVVNWMYHQYDPLWICFRRANVIIWVTKMFHQQSADFYKTHWAFTYIAHKALKIGLYIYVTFARKCKNRALMLSIVAYLTSSLSSRLYRDRELCRGLSFNHLLNPSLSHGICEFQGSIQRYLNAQLHILIT